MKKFEKILLILPIISLIVVVYSLFTYGVATVHSDNAVELTAIEAMMNHKSLFPHEWIYRNGDINVMRIQLFLALPFLIFNNWAIARAVGNLIVVSLACVSLIYLSKKYFRNNCWIILIPLFMIFYRGRTADVVLYSSMYTSIIFYTIIFAIWTYSFINSNSNVLKNVLMSILLCFVLSGGTRWAAEITVPLLLTAMIQAYLEVTRGKANSIKVVINKYIKVFAIVLIPSIIGIGIYLYVIRTHAFSNAAESGLWYVATLDALGKSLLETIKSFFKCFGYEGNSKVVSLIGIRNLISIATCLLICFIVPTLQLIRIKKEEKHIQYFLTYAYVHNAVLFLTTVITGKAMEVVAYRVVSIIFLATIISCRYIWVNYIDSDNVDRYLYMLIAAAFTIIIAVAMVKKNSDWKYLYATHMKVVEDIKNHGLSKGYGSYWNTYMYEAYSNGEIEFGELDFDENGVYTGSSGLVDQSVYNTSNEKSFIILTEDENEFTDSFEKVFGEPVDEWVIEGATGYRHGESSWEAINLYVYEYDYDIASKLSK